METLVVEPGDALKYLWDGGPAILYSPAANLISHDCHGLATSPKTCPPPVPAHAV